MTNNSRNAMTEFLDWHQVRHSKTAASRGWLYVLMTLTLLLIRSGCERWSLDRQMEALCKKDAGIKVYETVTLPASEFNNTGQPLARYVPTANSPEEYLGPDYRYVLNIEILVGPHANAEKGEGQLRQIRNLIYRRSDARLLGEQVWYDRSGGDGFTFGFQPSGKSCPHFERDLAQSIFIKGK